MGLMIVVVFLIVFFLKLPPKIDMIDENNPQASIETCTREAVEDAISILQIHGGDIVPKGSVLYKGEERVFICFTDEYYRQCIMQRPLFVEHIEKEITSYIYPKIQMCFEELKLKLQNRYNIEDSKSLNVTTKLFPKHIGIMIEKDFKMSRDEYVRSFYDFRVNLVHPMYNFADLTTEIANQEAKYCHFDELGFMILYPQYDVFRTQLGDPIKIYILKERVTNEEFTFAIKSCPLPPGY